MNYSFSFLLLKYFLDYQLALWDLDLDFFYYTFCLMELWFPSGVTLTNLPMESPRKIIQPNCVWLSVYSQRSNLLICRSFPGKMWYFVLSNGSKMLSLMIWLGCGNHKLKVTISNLYLGLEASPTNPERALSFNLVVQCHFNNYLVISTDRSLVWWIVLRIYNVL